MLSLYTTAKLSVGVGILIFNGMNNGPGELSSNPGLNNGHLFFINALSEVRIKFSLSMSKWDCYRTL